MKRTRFGSLTTFMVMTRRSRKRWPRVTPIPGRCVCQFLDRALLADEHFRVLHSGCCEKGGLHEREPFFDDVQALSKFRFLDDERRADPQHVEAAEGVEVLAL